VLPPSEKRNLEIESIISSIFFLQQRGATSVR